MDWNAGLEDAFTTFSELIAGNEDLEAEFGTSQQRFALEGRPEAERLVAERRHLEWFLCERPSDALEGVPVETLREPWSAKTDEDRLGFADVLLGSVASAYQVRSVAPDGHVLLRDVFGLAELDVLEPEGAAELAVGDLIVGRLFPSGPDLYRMSRAASVFRDATLVQALEEDVERMRGGRARILRMQQSELEALFFGSGRHVPRESAHVATAGLATTEPTSESSVQRARKQLLAAGVDADHAAQTVERILARTGSPAEISAEIASVLDELAFETRADLEQARRALAELHAELATQPKTSGTRAAGTPSAAVANQAPGELAGDAARTARALARFDEGRAQGQDLEALFGRLERDLGVDGEEGPDVETTPDFPGVVGAMVEEFLWELDATKGAADDVRRFGILRHLSQYGADIGTFENLGARDLLDFAGRWVLEQRVLQDAQQGHDLVFALRAFCQWCDASHSLELWQDFEDLWSALRDDLPRLLRVSPHVHWEAAPTSDSYRIVSSDASRLQVVSDDEHELTLQPFTNEHDAARAGDLVRLAVRPEGTVLCRLYPAVLERLRSEREARES